MSNPFSTGGGGISFENSIQTIFVINMLINGRVPCLPNGEMSSILLQGNSESYETDDLVIFFESTDNIKHKLLVQVKHELSFTENNSTLKEVLADFWKDYNNPKIFNQKHDRFLIIKNSLNKKESNHVRVILDWAKDKPTYKEFENLLETSKEKKKVFDTFFNVIKEIQTNITSTEIYSFLKVIDLLAYDLTTTNSIYLNHLKTVVELAKKDDVHLNADDIISKIYHYISNKNYKAATLLREELKLDLDFFKDNYKITSSISVQKLMNDSRYVLEKINEDVNNIHLDRNFIGKNSFDKLLSENQFIIFYGGAGMGKSAYSKKTLSSVKNSCLFSFVADQFLESRLSITLNKMGVTEEIDKLFSRFFLLPNKIIYIDSFEKLLEGHGEAFEELLLILKKFKDIKVVISCRDYALEGLLFKYFDTEKHTIFKAYIPELDDNELNFFLEKLPALKEIVKNKNIKSLIRNPKYLSLATKLLHKTSQDYSSFSQNQFKAELWKFIIEDTANSKRGQTFINIAVKRAKKLTLLTSVEEFDIDSVSDLKKDGILFEENNLYAPSHDIFEDWALIKHIEIHRSNYPNINDFYNNLGNQPAMRRAFRLWVERKIAEPESKWINTFVHSSIEDKSIDNHWQDETITAILNSNYCEKYVSENEHILLDDNNKLIMRFLHLLRVSCKDSEQYPKGFAWDILFKFIHKNILSLENSYPLILKSFFDWQIILQKNNLDNNNDTHKYVGEISYKFLEDYENKSSWMNTSNEKKDLHKTIRLLYDLAEFIPIKTKEYLTKIAGQNDKENDWTLSDYERKRVKYALSHLYSGKLTKIFPTELISIANSFWKINKEKEKKREEERKKNSRFYFPEKKELPYFFGLVDKHDFGYFPKSAYQTFVYRLLCHNPIKGTKFVIDFTNYCAENFVKSDKNENTLRRQEDIVNTSLSLDKSERKIYGSSYFWSIFREGQWTVPDLLQSVVIALERYLYELGELDFDRTNKILLWVFDEIYEKANSVILISVLSSITQAYPLKIKDKVLPLINFDFLKWDRNRALHESTLNNRLSHGFPSATVEGRIADTERIEASKWEHRRKYWHGLIGFILLHQTNTRTYNKEIFERIDALKSTIDDNDILDKKLVFEIDARNFKAEEVSRDDKKITYHVGPDYSKDGELSKFNEKVLLENTSREEAASYSLWTTKTYKNETDENRTYEHWKRCLNFFKTYDTSNDFIMDNIPLGTLSILGIKLFKDQLTDAETQNCLNTILEISQKLYKEKSERSYDFNNRDFSLNIYDKGNLLEFLPILIENKEELNKEQLEELYNLVFFFILDVDFENDVDVRNLYNNFKNQLWKTDYSFAYNCFFGLIMFAKITKQYPIYRKNYTEKELHEIEEEKKKIYHFIFNSKEDNLKLEKVSYKTHSSEYLIKALDILSIENSFYFTNTFLQDLLASHVETFIDDKLSNYFKIGTNIQRNIAAYLIFNDTNEDNQELFENVLMYSLKEYNWKSRREVIEYLNRILNSMVTYIDKNNENSKYINNFWTYWTQLFSFINDNHNYAFIKEFLLYSPYWKSEATNWKVFDNNQGLFLNQIKNLKETDVESLLILFSGIGFQQLMPNGLMTLNKHLKSNAKNIEEVKYYYGEKLIQKIFKNQIRVIKEDSILFEEFLWFLNLMIDLGSSKAYLIRENIILYKDN